MRRSRQCGFHATAATSRVMCSGICKGGPVVVTCSEGTWYGGVTPDVATRILYEHLAKGRVVTDVFWRNPPCGRTAPGQIVQLMY